MILIAAQGAIPFRVTGRLARQELPDAPITALAA
jgi:hypothetical protein